MTAAVPKVASKIEDIHAESEVKAMFAPTRREQRVDEVRSAEYTAFPRTRANQTPRRGFTRDVSPLGMCLGVDEQEPIGALLRIEVRQLDGHRSAQRSDGSSGVSRPETDASGSASTCSARRTACVRNGIEECSRGKTESRSKSFLGVRGVVGNCSGPPQAFRGTANLRR